MTNDELIAKIEAGEVPLRELDCEIAVCAAGFFTIPPKWEGGPVGYGYTDSDGHEVHPGHGGDQLVCRYTASIDAALTLVPSPPLVTMEIGPKITEVAIQYRSAGKPMLAEGRAATPALALCAAALRARNGGDDGR